jgi:hypothetical protein
MVSRPLYRLERVLVGGKVEAINNYHSKAEAERDARAFRRYIKKGRYRVRRLTEREMSSFENPAGIRAQVRRLPSGQVQIKIPLKRTEDPAAIMGSLRRVFGKRVKAVEMVGGGRRWKSNPSQIPVYVVVRVGQVSDRGVRLSSLREARQYRRQHGAGLAIYRLNQRTGGFTKVKG